MLKANLRGDQIMRYMRVSFARLLTYLGLAISLVLFVAAPLQAQVKWRHGLTQARADAGFFYMAHEKGFFKKHGVDVEFIHLRGDKDLIRALLAGELDSCEPQPGVSLNAIDRGADLRFIGSSMTGFAFALYANKNITSWDQLKGKTFGVSAPGSLPQVMGRAMLFQKGVDANTMKIANAGGSSSRIKALVAGRIDATISSSEFLPDIDKLGIRLMGLAADLVPLYPRSTIVAAQKTLETKRDAAINFLAGYMEGLAYAAKHRDETLALTARITNKQPDDSQIVYMYDEVIAKGYLSTTAEIPRAKLTWLQDELIRQGEVRKAVDLDKAIDETYRTEALKRVAHSSNR